jgi:hypothetical protein
MKVDLILVNQVNVAINGQGSKLLIILSKCEKVNKETYTFINARLL